MQLAATAPAIPFHIAAYRPMRYTAQYYSLPAGHDHKLALRKCPRATHSSRAPTEAWEKTMQKKKDSFPLLYPACMVGGLLKPIHFRTSSIDQRSSATPIQTIPGLENLQFR